MLYAKISPTPYGAPVDPGITATVSTAATMAQLSQLRYDHSKSQRIYNNHHDMDAALNPMLPNAVEYNELLISKISTHDIWNPLL